MANVRPLNSQKAAPRPNWSAGASAVSAIVRPERAKPHKNQRMRRGGAKALFFLFGAFFLLFFFFLAFFFFAQLVLPFFFGAFLFQVQFFLALLLELALALLFFFFLLAGDVGFAGVRLGSRGPGFGFRRRLRFGPGFW